MDSIDRVIFLMCFLFLKCACAIWVQINNVGTNIRKPTVDYTDKEFATLMTANFESAYHLTQLGHPLLKASGMGSIVFISSVAGVVAIRSGTIYAATKGNVHFISTFLLMCSKYKNVNPMVDLFFMLLSGAMNQLTKNLACEWAKDNIRANCVAPWYIKTSLVEHVRQCSLQLF